MIADFSIMIKNEHSNKFLVIVCYKSTIINIPDWCDILSLHWLKNCWRKRYSPSINLE